MLNPNHPRYHDDTFPEPPPRTSEDEAYERWLDEQARDQEWLRLHEGGLSTTP